VNFILTKMSWTIRGLVDWSAFISSTTAQLGCHISWQTFFNGGWRTSRGNIKLMRSAAKQIHQKNQNRAYPQQGNISAKIINFRWDMTKAKQQCKTQHNTQIMPMSYMTGNIIL